MVANFQHGGAAINQLCRANGVTLSVDAFDLDDPTADFTRGPAMTDGGCAAAFARGMASVLPGTDLLVIGEMGIANTTAAAAICHALFGGSAADWTGRGTGVDDDHLRLKIEVVEKGVTTMPATTRWRCCDAWVDTRSRPWRGLSSPRAWRTFR